MNKEMPVRPPTPQAMFDTIAPYYDFTNTALSLGMERLWRRRAVQLLPPREGGVFLDVATGTGTMARALLAHLPESAKVIGCDVNDKMLDVGRRRLARHLNSGRLQLIKGEGEQLPFPDAHFDGATIAFAIDDMRDRVLCMREIARVLRKGAPLVLLELSLPENPVLLSIYRLYLKTFPAVGRLLRRGGGYEHLREEILLYRGRKAIEELLEQCSFGEYSRRSLTGGVATAHCALRQ